MNLDSAAVSETVQELTICRPIGSEGELRALRYNHSKVEAFGTPVELQGFSTDWLEFSTAKLTLQCGRPSVSPLIDPVLGSQRTQAPATVALNGMLARTQQRTPYTSDMAATMTLPGWLGPWHRRWYASQSRSS